MRQRRLVPVVALFLLLLPGVACREDQLRDAAKTSATIADLIKATADVRDALADPAARAALDRAGATIEARGPEPFAALLAADFPRWGEVIRRGNIKLD